MVFKNLLVNIINMQLHGDYKKNKPDGYTWLKRILARDTPIKKVKKLFYKRYGRRNGKFLQSVLVQFGYDEKTTVEMRTFLAQCRRHNRLNRLTREVEDD